MVGRGGLLTSCLRRTSKYVTNTTGNYVLIFFSNCNYVVGFCNTTCNYVAVFFQNATTLLAFVTQLATTFSSSFSNCNYVVGFCNTTCNYVAVFFQNATTLLAFVTQHATTFSSSFLNCNYVVGCRNTTCNYVGYVAIFFSKFNYIVYHNLQLRRHFLFKLQLCCWLFKTQLATTLLSFFKMQLRCWLL